MVKLKKLLCLLIIILCIVSPLSCLKVSAADSAANPFKPSPSLQELIDLYNGYVSKNIPCYITSTIRITTNHMDKDKKQIVKFYTLVHGNVGDKLVTNKVKYSNCDKEVMLNSFVDSFGKDSIVSTPNMPREDGSFVTGSGTCCRSEVTPMVMLWFGDDVLLGYKSCKEYKSFVFGYWQNVSDLNNCTDRDDKYFTESYDSEMCMLYNPNGMYSGVAPTVTKLNPYEHDKADVSADDIQNFKWDGDGIKIFSPSPNSDIVGYMNPQSKDVNLYDVVIYGKFTYKEPWYVWDSMVKNKIVSTFRLNIDGKEFKSTDGIALKNFEWVTAPNGDGNEAQFKMTWSDVCHKFDKGYLQVSCDLPSDSGYKNYMDAVSGLKISQDFSDIDKNGYKPPGPGQVTGQDDNRWKDDTNKKDDTGTTTPKTIGEWVEQITNNVKDLFGAIFELIVAPFKYLFSIISTIGGYSTSCISSLKGTFDLINGCFPFIPEPVRDAVWFAILVGIGMSVLRIIRR